MKTPKDIFKKIQGAKNAITKIQKELKNQRIEADAGAGLVKIIVNGNQEIIEVHIDPELIQLKDLKLLEDLIKAAVNQARQKALEVSQELMQKTIDFNPKDITKLFQNDTET